MVKTFDSCTLSDLAQMAGMDRRTFQDLLLREDLVAMLGMGWNPFARKLPPSVVRYLREKFIDTTLKN